MNEAAQQGRDFALRLFVSIILLSLISLEYHQSLVEVSLENKLTKQIVRLLLNVVLMYFTLQGKKWAILLYSSFMAIAVTISVVALFSTADFYPKIPLLVMVLLYGVALYYLNRSSNFKEYIRHKNS